MTFTNVEGREEGWLGVWAWVGVGFGFEGRSNCFILGYSIYFFSLKLINVVESMLFNKNDETLVRVNVVDNCNDREAFSSDF